MKDSSRPPLSGAKRTYFRAAEGMAALSNHRCKMGCVVVKGHRIISSGHNSATITHAFQAKVDGNYFGCDCAGFLHAETDALIPLINNKIDLTQSTIFVYRKMPKGGRGMARPCPRCMGVIRSLDIKKINYSTPEGFAEEVVL